MAPMAGPEKYNFLINSTGYMTEESQFQNIVLKATESNAQVVRLKDVAKVQLDAQQYITYFKSVVRDPTTHKLKVVPATALALYLVPGANQLQVKKDYETFLTKTEILREENKDKFSLDKMVEKFKSYIPTETKEEPVQKQLNLPKLNKIK